MSNVSPSATAPTTRRGGFTDRLARLQLGRYSGVFILIALIAIFSVWLPSTFLTDATWKTIAQGQSITAILAVSLLFPLAAGGFDLSAAQIMGFCALICGTLITKEPTLGVPAAIGISLLAGAAIGALNGFLVTTLNLGSFISTLGTTSLLVGFAALVGNGEFVGPFPDSFRALTAGNVFGLPVLTLYLLVIAVVLWYFLEHTPWGRRIYATGANPDAARLAGVRTNSFLFWSFVISGTGASIAGVLLASNLNSVSQSLRAAVPAPCVRGGIPGHHAAEAGSIQHLGHSARDLPPRNGRARAEARRCRSLGHRCLQWSGTPHRRVDHGVHAGAARSARGEGQGERGGRRCSRRRGCRRNGSEAARG